MSFLGHPSVLCSLQCQASRYIRQQEGNTRAALSVYASSLLYTSSNQITLRNQFFVYFGTENIGFGGGGGGFAFMLDEELCQGTSCTSDTYSNDSLSFTDHFSCKELELWTLERD